MRIIPVLDIKAGVAVHARGGDRSHYGPVSSVWHPGSADPRVLVEGYKRKYTSEHMPEIYLADLDAIGGAGPDLDLYRDLAAKGIRLWVDAGARSAVDCAGWFEAGVAVAVLGLETIAGPEALAEAVARWGAGRVLFSLDLRHGRPMVHAAADWGTDSPLLIGETAAAMGARRLLVLDVGRVGTGAGVGDVELIRGLVAMKNRDVFVGGGVGGGADVEALGRIGVAGAMVGTAVHRGLVEP